MFQPHTLFCICLLFISANGFQEQAKPIDLQNDGAKSNAHQCRNAKRFVKKMARLNLDGDYGPSANVDTVLSPPPPPFTMKKLLEDYTPMANKRNSPSPRRRLFSQAHTLTVKGRSFTASLHRAELLQDYSPSSNQRTKSPPPSMRRLLQDYSPVANDRSPSGGRRRRLLQDYSPAANDRSPSGNRKRKLLQDYSPVANYRTSINNKRRLLQD